MTESSHHPDHSLSRALGLARKALAVEPSGLLTDFDGTLSLVVADPSLARLVGGAEAALTALAERLAVVAVITGRAASEARRLTAVPRMLIVGNHGVEWLEADAAQPTRPAGAQAAEARLDVVLAAVPAHAGVVVEPKGLSATLHYRNAADPEAFRARILRMLAGVAAAQDVEVREGRMSVELRPRGLGDKGHAALAIVERHGLRGVVVMGDDLTDLDMFVAMAELRVAGRVRAAILAVGGAGREVPPGVSAAADVTLRDPEAAALLLGELAGPLSG